MNIWYNSLIKPPLTPPVAYFPIAWGILYVLMGIAFLIIVFKPYSKSKVIAISMFLAQLVLNLLWSCFFFGMQSPKIALVDVVLLLILLIYTIIRFFKLSKLAGLLLVPYLLQVIFATYLNSGIVLLN